MMIMIVALFVSSRLTNIYIIDLFDSKAFNEKYLVVVNNDAWLWHKRLGHANMHMISNLSYPDLVKGLLKLKYEKDLVCEACVTEKHLKSSFHCKNIISTSRSFDLSHMDLFGPMSILSLEGKTYCFVIVDDYSRFS